MEFRKTMLDYARQEAAYLPVRADKRGADGPRSAGEGYAKVTKIEWKTGDRLDGFQFTYSDGLTRRWGNSTDFNEQYNMEEGEFICQGHQDRMEDWRQTRWFSVH